MMKKQKRSVILIFIYLILLAVLIYHFDVIENHIDMCYGAIGGIILMMINIEYLTFQSRKQEQEELKKICEYFMNERR